MAVLSQKISTRAHFHTLWSQQKGGAASFPIQPLPRPDFTFTQGGMSSNYSEALLNHVVGSLSRIRHDLDFVTAVTSHAHRVALVDGPTNKKRAPHLLVWGSLFCVSDARSRV